MPGDFIVGPMARTIFHSLTRLPAGMVTADRRELKLSAETCRC